MAKLIITDGVNGQMSEYIITKPETKIGRNPDLNDIVLPSRQVSSTHALLRQVEGEYLLIDLQSTNGTYIHGQRIKEQVIKHADIFSIGNYAIGLIDAQARVTASKDSANLEETTIAGWEKEDTEPPPNRLDQQIVSQVPAIGVYQAESLDYAFSPSSLEAQLAEKVKILETLYSLGKMLSSVFNIDEIFKQIADLLLNLTPAERCAILVIDPELQTLEPRFIKRDAVKRPQTESSGEFLISSTITKKVVAERYTLLSVDNSHQTEPPRSVMCAPLLGKAGVLGVIYVDKANTSGSFSADNLALLNAVASQAGIAVDNAQAYEQLSQEAIARASFQRFLPPHIIDIILESPERLQLGGTVQLITVLFADIRQFTPLAERSQPQIVVEVLNKFFSVMTEIVFANLGMLDKYIGDGLMALFGAPYVGEDDAINAVNAAVAMQRQLCKLNAELVNYGFSPLEIGIGINSGKVTLGCVGSERRMEYTAIGRAVNLASRLMSQAKGREILISDTTYNLLQSTFPTADIGDMAFKGISGPTRVYQVIYN
jgi:adenylate cyclase